MLERRLEILFDPADYERLRQVADEQGRSIGELVREAVHHRYLIPEAESRKAALARLLSGEFDMDWPDWPELERMMEQEKTREILGQP